MKYNIVYVSMCERTVWHDRPQGGCGRLIHQSRVRATESSANGGATPLGAVHDMNENHRPSASQLSSERN